MEREELKFCEVHTALFLAGTNLGLKLDPTRRSGLKLWSDEAKKRVYIEWNGETGWTPETNVAIAIPGMPNAPQPPAGTDAQSQEVIAQQAAQTNQNVD